MTVDDRRKRKRLYNTLAGVTSVVIAVLYVISLGLGRDYTEELIDPSSRPDNNLPDKIATGLEVYGFDKNGQLSHILTSEKAEYYDTHLSPEQPMETRTEVELESHSLLSQTTIETNHTDFSDAEYGEAVQSGNAFVQLHKPTVVFYRPNKSAIRGYAVNGSIYPSTTTIALAGDVMISDSKTESFLYSDSLTINSLEKQLFTHDPVKLLGPQSLTTARGLQGNFIQGHWQFLGDVRSTINPG